MLRLPKGVEPFVSAPAHVTLEGQNPDIDRLNVYRLKKRPEVQWEGGNFLIFRKEYPEHKLKFPPFVYRQGFDAAANLYVKAGYAIPNDIGGYDPVSYDLDTREGMIGPDIIWYNEHQPDFSVRIGWDVYWYVRNECELLFERFRLWAAINRARAERGD